MPKSKSVQRPIMVADATEPPPQRPSSFGPRPVGLASCALARPAVASRRSSAAVVAAPVVQLSMLCLRLRNIGPPPPRSTALQGFVAEVEAEARFSRRSLAAPRAVEYLLARRRSP